MGAVRKDVQEAYRRRRNQADAARGSQATKVVLPVASRGVNAPATSGS